MSLRSFRLMRRTLLAALLTLVPVLALAGPAAAATRVLSYQCQGMTPLGPVNGFAYQDVLDATAPAVVAAGAPVTITVKPRRNNIPPTIDDRPVVHTRNITLKLPLPTNSTFVSGSLADGSGTGPVFVAVSGGNLVFSIPGPIAGGAEFVLPTLTLTVTAGPAAGGPVVLKLDGFTLANPALTFTARIQGTTVTADVSTSCFPNPNVVLTSTNVV